MTIEKLGNLGQNALLQIQLAKKRMESFSKKQIITISESELKKIEDTLKDFDYVLSNLYLYENTLKNDQYGGLLRVIKDMKEKDY